MWLMSMAFHLSPPTGLVENEAMKKRHITTQIQSSQEDDPQGDPRPKKRRREPRDDCSELRGNTEQAHAARGGEDDS